MTDQPPKHAVFSPGWSAFSQDWFTQRIPQWKQFLVPALAGKPVKWLEIGSYEGRSALWTLENVLTSPESAITCVDIWKGDYEARFDANLKDAIEASKAVKIKGDAFQVLVELAFQGQTFDAVYVDADHQAKAALTEAAIAWRMLKKGGFLIFDDYNWKHKTEADRKTKLPPKPGIDAFLECWQYELRVLHKGWQVIVQKL